MTTHTAPSPFGLPTSHGAPEWIRVAPFGAWEHPKAGHFEVTRDNASVMAANHQRVGMDRVVDFEHQTLHRGKAPAAGWIKELDVRSDGLWARVDWTGEARHMIEAKQYRYFSPVFDFAGRDPGSGKRVGAVLHSVALTNDPFLESDIPPLAAKRLFVPCARLATKAALTPEDRAVCLLFGTDEAEFAIAKADYRARVAASE